MAMLIPAAISAVGTIIGGAAQKSASEYEAQQYRTEAAQQQAAAQRKAAATTQEKERLISSQRAAGAASGYGGATDASTLQNIGNVEAEGTLRSMQDLYAGAEAARGLRNKAAAAQFEGKTAMTAGLIGGAAKAGQGIADTVKSWSGTYG